MSGLADTDMDGWLEPGEPGVPGTDMESLESDDEILDRNSSTIRSTTLTKKKIEGE